MDMTAHILEFNRDRIKPKSDLEKATLEEAVDEIKSIRQQVAAMGGHRDDLSKLDDIMDRCQEGKILPKDALIEARKIFDQK